VGSGPRGLKTRFLPASAKAFLPLPPNLPLPVNQLSSSPVQTFPKARRNDSCSHGRCVLEDRRSLQGRVGCPQCGHDIPRVPTLHEFAVPKVHNAHHGNGDLRTRWRQVAKRSCILQRSGKADRHSIFSTKDIFDLKVRLSKCGQELLRRDAKLGWSRRGCAASTQVMGHCIGGEQFINCFQAAPIPYFFKPAADDCGIFVLQHGEKDDFSPFSCASPQDPALSPTWPLVFTPPWPIRGQVYQSCDKQTLGLSANKLISILAQISRRSLPRNESR
jgi:hypothetical protein